MEEQLIKLMLDDAEIAGLVGQRIRPATRHQTDALPAVIVQTVSGAPSYSLSGPSGLSTARVQIDAYGSSYSQAKTLSRLIVDRLSGIREPFEGCFLTNETDTTEATDTILVYRTRLDFNIIFNRG